MSKRTKNPILAYTETEEGTLVPVPGWPDDLFHRSEAAAKIKEMFPDGCETPFIFVRQAGAKIKLAVQLKLKLEEV